MFLFMSWRDLDKNFYLFVDHLCWFSFFPCLVTRTDCFQTSRHEIDSVPRNRFLLQLAKNTAWYSRLSECVALGCWFPLSEFASRKIDPPPMPSVPCRSTFLHNKFVYFNALNLISFAKSLSQLTFFGKLLKNLHKLRNKKAFSSFGKNSLSSTSFSRMFLSLVSL